MPSLKAKFKKIISIPYQVMHELHKFLYRSGLLKAKKLQVPVISIGNISFGGTGKTPFTIYLAERLSEIFNKKICILTRAYKSRIPKSSLPIIINSNNIKQFLDSEYVQGVRETEHVFIGDEATLMLELIQKNSMISMAIDSNRYAAAEKALQMINPNLFILDDAQQHLKLEKDFRIILININESGYYREFPAILDSADCLIYSKVDNHWLLQEENKNKIAIVYNIKLSKEIDKNKSVTAFAGLADPDYFFKLLEDNLKNQYFYKKFNTIKFPDHHGYSIDEIEALVSLEENLICTAKDFVKIPSEYQKFFIVAKLELKIINEDILINKLKDQFFDN
ncbi:MAG: tetraacyldisaccharide 4'-kinase [Cyanobacteria bacterium REEB446]|nr:tetraacyldisaccharide 4'-kinase [Cyanobacteria bacterium REEB446]